MNQKPFDPTKPVQTRDGRKARIVCTDATQSDYPIVALIDSVFGEVPYAFRKDGTRFPKEDLDMTEIDLINIPVKKEGWVNVYAPGFQDFYVGWCSHAYRTKDQADKEAQPDRLDCVRIEWEE